MKNAELKTLLDEIYPAVKHPVFSGRYLPFPKIESELKSLSSLNFDLKTEGHSVLENPIYSVETGQGKNKILMWSQMHGNETTTTKAVFDLLNMFSQQTETSFVKEIFENCTIKILPVLNPDGAKAYTRENHVNIDLNRDAKNLSQPESGVLDKIFNEFQPDFCFNLHDQRTIYSAGKTRNPATLSFLAPSPDEAKTHTGSRKTAMKLISNLNGFLQQIIPGKIGRYDDGFNENCTGDKFQSKGIPTLLFEAGHFPGDYQREETRKLVFFSLIKTLADISQKTYLKSDYEEYFRIPENQKLFYDVVVRKLQQNNITFDLGIQYSEHLKGNKIDFVPIIEEKGDLSGFFGHREVDEKDEQKLLKSPLNPKIGSVAEYLKINGEVILLKLSKH